MKLLFTNTSAYYVGGRRANIMVETDGERLYVTVCPEKYTTLSPKDAELYVTYNGETCDMSSYPFRERTVSFPYVRDVKSISVSETDGSTGATFSWKGDVYDPTPRASVAFAGAGDTPPGRVSYECEVEGNYTACLIGMVTHIWDEDRQSWFVGYRTFDKDTSGSYAAYLLDNEDYWDKCQFDLYFAAYKNSNDAHGDYVGIYKYSSPEYLVVGYSSPYAPYNLTYNSLTAGGSGKVRWSRLYDSKHKVVNFELQRSIDGGEFESIYRGQDKYYIDTLPEDAVTVVYRVAAMNGTVIYHWCVGEKHSAALCNVYVGVDGEIRPASAVYIGMGGVPTVTTSLFEVG